jgi:hypothetical protein
MKSVIINHFLNSKYLYFNFKHNLEDLENILINNL